MKKVVYYVPHDLDQIIRGHRALIVNPPIGHTSPDVSGEHSVITSPVVKILGDGFETENTVYKRK